MSQPERTLRDSPVDFGTAVAYALHPEMRRLLILYLVGSILLPAGLSVLVTNDLTGTGFIDGPIGIGPVLVGAAFFFGGVVGALFKIVTDANRLAARSA
jgi:hypothetical protein